MCWRWTHSLTFVAHEARDSLFNGVQEMELPEMLEALE
jgi:hypothetical protein